MIQSLMKAFFSYISQCCTIIVLHMFSVCKIKYRIMMRWENGKFIYVPYCTLRYSHAQYGCKSINNRKTSIAKTKIKVFIPYFIHMYLTIVEHFYDREKTLNTHKQVIYHIFGIKSTYHCRKTNCVPCT